MKNRRFCKWCKGSQLRQESIRSVSPSRKFTVKLLNAETAENRSRYQNQSELTTQTTSETPFDTVSYVLQVQSSTHYRVFLIVEYTQMEKTSVVQLNSSTQSIPILVPPNSLENNRFTVIRNLNSLSTMLKEAASVLVHEPNGCFEQTSSSLYPMIVLSKLSNLRSAKTPILHGLDRLLSFEVEGGGFSWFGKAPAHESLSSLGLLQFIALRPLLEKWGEQERLEKLENAMNRTMNWLNAKLGSFGFGL